MTWLAYHVNISWSQSLILHLLLPFKIMILQLHFRQRLKKKPPRKMEKAAAAVREGDSLGGFPDDLEYQSGFDNHFSSEAIAGALPRGQNSPLICPFGLYAEQISGTSFTSPRKVNQRSWLYRIKPSVTHEPFWPRSPSHKKLVSEFDRSNTVANPTQLRWKPVDIPNSPTDFIDGLYTICGAGSSFLRHGYAIHM